MNVAGRAWWCASGRRGREEGEGGGRREEASGCLVAGRQGLGLRYVGRGRVSGWQRERGRSWEGGAHGLPTDARDAACLGSTIHPRSFTPITCAPTPSQPPCDMPRLQALQPPPPQPHPRLRYRCAWLQLPFLIDHECNQPPSPPSPPSPPPPPPPGPRSPHS